MALLAIAPRAVAGSSFDAQIGWLTEGCLAVPNGAIEPGALVTFLLFEPERAEGHVPLVGGHSAQGGAELARALEPFFTTKTLGSGTGLGLSQVHGVARQSGGTVRIESKLGHGTKIWVYFPRAGSVAAPRTIERTELPRSGRQGSILVVDDDRDVRRDISTALAGFGYTVTEATNARDALDIPGRGDRFDLALIDYAMPATNGKELVKALLLRHSAPRHILFMTGYVADADGILDEAAGGAVLRKRFTAVELANAVERLISEESGQSAKVIRLKPQAG